MLISECRVGSNMLLKFALLALESELYLWRERVSASIIGD